MVASRFSIRETIKKSWEIVTGNIGAFLLSIVIIGAFAMAPVIPAVGRSPAAVAVFMIFSMVLTLGFIRLALRFVDGEKGEVIDLFGTFNLALAYIGASILASLLAGIGFLLLIIPGIYIGVRLQFYTWSLVDLECGPIDALKHSWEITQNSVGKLLLLAVSLSVLNMVGTLALGLGLLVTGPMSLVSMGLVYRQLSPAGA